MIMFGEKERWCGKFYRGVERKVKISSNLVFRRVGRVVSVFDWGLKHLISRYVIKHIKNQLTKAILDT